MKEPDWSKQPGVDGKSTSPSNPADICAAVNCDYRKQGAVPSCTEATVKCKTRSGHMCRKARKSLCCVQAPEGGGAISPGVVVEEGDCCLYVKVGSPTTGVGFRVAPGMA